MESALKEVKETLQRDPKDRSEGLQHQSRPVGTEAQDRDKWRAAVNKGAKQPDEEEQNQQISRSHRYCLFTLPEDVSCADWPDKSFAYPPTPTSGWSSSNRRTTSHILVY